MIFGIGSDIVEVRRIERSLSRFGQRFVTRLLLPEERRLYAQSRNPVRFMAMRFAAKEAIVKAMGTGFAHGVWIRDVGITANPWGRPEVIYSRRGASRARELGIGEAHITLTDEAGLVVAMAVLMRAPGG